MELQSTYTFDTGRGILWRQRILLYSFPCLRFFPSSFIQHLFCISKRNNVIKHTGLVWNCLLRETFISFVLKNDIFRRKSTDLSRENYYILYNLPPSLLFKFKYICPFFSSFVVAVFILHDFIVSDRLLLSWPVILILVCFQYISQFNMPIHN